MAVYKETHEGEGTLFVAVDLKKQLIPGTFEFTLYHVVNMVDLSCFDTSYKNDKTGASAYSPAVLLKIIFYCYSKGVIFSRKIMRMCEEHIILHALSGQAVPHWTTIASFIRVNDAAVKEVFTQVLLECDTLGLISGELFAIDGCKLSSNASKEWSGTIEELKKKQQKWEALAEELIRQHNAQEKSDKTREEEQAYKEQI